MESSRHSDRDQGARFVLMPGGDSGRSSRLTYGSRLDVLHVTHDRDTEIQFKQAAIESVLEVRVETEHDRHSAMRRLERSVNAPRRRPLPDVVVLALAVPESHTLLAHMQSDGRFSDVPVIVLAATSDPELERRSFSLGATAHFQAPRRAYERVALVHSLPNFIPNVRATRACIESER